jgi:hypothetical protein
MFTVCAAAFARVAFLYVPAAAAASAAALSVLLPQDLQESLSLLGSMPPDAVVAPKPADLKLGVDVVH